MIILLDNGHGRETPGKRSPVWHDGRQLFEWEFNRDIVARVMTLAPSRGVLVAPLVPEVMDISLGERVRRANRWWEESDHNCLLLSIHANAGGGTGFEFYTSRGRTKSDRYADIIIAQYERNFPNEQMRFDLSDGDKDKEADFYLLKNTKCPAVLIENLFMDYEPDCRKLLDGAFRQRIAECITASLITIGGGV